MIRTGARRLVLLAGLVSAGAAGCAVHDTTAAATTVLGYWSAEASRGAVDLEIFEHRGNLLLGRCTLRTANPFHAEPCDLQVAYADSSFRTSLVSYSFRWVFDGRQHSATEIRGRLTGMTFTGPMDETVFFVKTPRRSGSSR